MEVVLSLLLDGLQKGDSGEIERTALFKALNQYGEYPVPSFVPSLSKTSQYVSGNLFFFSGEHLMEDEMSTILDTLQKSDLPSRFSRDYFVEEVLGYEAAQKAENVQILTLDEEQASSSEGL
jgi:hypothetical protein